MNMYAMFRKWWEEMSYLVCWDEQVTELRQEESLEKEADNKSKCNLYQVGGKP